MPHRGHEHLRDEDEFEALAGSDAISGEAAFTLAATYGFPLELTVELAEERGQPVDVDGYRRAMAEHREISRAGGAFDISTSLLGAPRTEFVGYETLASDGRLLALLGPNGRTPVASEGEEVRFVLDRTPFYAESGGQVGDRGILRAPGGTIDVLDAQFGPGGLIVHTGVAGSGEIREGEEVLVKIEEPHMYNEDDAVAKIDGYMISVASAGRNIGEQRLVRIDRVGRSSAEASLVDVDGAGPKDDADDLDDDSPEKPKRTRRGRRGGRGRGKASQAEPAESAAE